MFHFKLKIYSDDEGKITAPLGDFFVNNFKSEFFYEVDDEKSFGPENLNAGCIFHCESIYIDEKTIKALPGYVEDSLHELNVS